MAHHHGFKRLAIEVNKNFKRDPLREYAKAIARYGMNPTLEGPYSRGSEEVQEGTYAGRRRLGGNTNSQQKILQKASSSGQKGEVSAQDVQNDSEYVVSVPVGTPPQNLKLDFDTGSADLWFLSTELSSSQQSQLKGKGHAVFDEKKSSTFKALHNYTWKISYGDGSSASGKVGTDVINLGGLKVTAQAVELATKISTEFASGYSDGLLGLAFSSINTVTPQPQKTPVDSMIAQSDIPKNAELFTAHLGSTKDTSDNSSFYTFGFIDDATLKANNATEPTYAPVDNSQGFWQVPSESYSINGKAVARSGNTAIMDTGTTLALVDDDVCKAIYDAIPGASYDSSAQGYIIPSTTKPSDIPVIGFNIGDKEYTLHQDDLLYADVGNGSYYGGIQSRGDLTFDILGDTMFKAIYAIFDAGNMRFGAVQRTEAASS